MPLSGHLSDLSLSELIEFFCNQRKTGQLKVLYPQGHGNFYLQTGSVVDARIGVLRGIEAVYYALTLPNAKFEFSGSDDAMERTINQPWTQVVLEGLRRLDEGVVPANAFPAGYIDETVQPKPIEPIESVEAETIEKLEAVETVEKVKSPPVKKVEPQPIQRDVSHDNPVVPVVGTVETRMPPFLSAETAESSGSRKMWVAVAVAIAIIGSVAAIGVPAGWYGRHNAAAVTNQPVTTDSNNTVSSSPTGEVPATESAQPSDQADVTDHSGDAALAARRQHEREKAKAREERGGMNQPSAALASPASSNVGPDSGKSGPKKVTVTVTYDESGRVTQASGGDATAVRIARQKRFPAGKAGSATITIPMN